MRGLVVLLALAGLTVSVLALKVHNMDPGLAPPCAVNEHWDCGFVNHSKYAVFPPKTFDEAPGTKHVPVAIVGIVGYVAILGAALAGRWFLTLTLVEIGFAAACFLSFLEAYVLQKWCIYCVYSQGILTSLVVVAGIGMFLKWRRVREVRYGN